MCAIIGYCGREIARDAFDAARDALKHRGPDDAGSYYHRENTVALGSRRLAIIDLSAAGHQPMSSEDGRYTIVFNGEIFNYLELKHELPDYEFRSDSDTEVLLAAFITWGKGCLNKLNGQFAFAIYDRTTGELFAARDHFGIKPFFYSFEGGVLAFASEIKALLALGIAPKPNERTIYEYLEYGLYDHRDETFFTGIKSLPPGHYFVYRNRALEIGKYWDLADVDLGKRRVTSREAAEEELRHLLQDSIRLQFRSDVPVGLNLSSGLDSNALLFYSKKIYPADLHVFTACIADETLNECPRVRQQLFSAGSIQWRTATLAPENVFGFAGPVLECEDQPYGGMPTIQYYNLYQQAIKTSGITVLIEGQGVDEILAGYNYYIPAFVTDALKRFKWGILRDQIASESGNAGGMKSFLKIMSLIGAPRGRSQDMTRESGLKITGESLIDAYAASGPPSFPKPFSSHLQNAQYRDIRYTKLPRVLRFNDHVSMAFSKELRVPYLDRRIVEFCFALPPELKIHAGFHKFLLRSAMREHIPAAMERNPKITFGAFQTPWFRKYFRGEVRTMLNSGSFKSRPYFNRSALEERVRVFFDGSGDNSFFLWQVINLELWLRKYID